MGVSNAMQWWDEWQLQVLVLASLGIQYFLAIFGALRRRRIPPWLRFFIWLSFLGSDAMAIYALATLFNRQWKLQQCSSTHGSHDLEVFWAPILLMHLGGQTCITAYNLEDNELWKRHVVTSLSQVMVAVYVFHKSWSPSADKRLLVAAILLFISRIVKCVDKPINLKSSSFDSLSTFVNEVRRTTSRNLGLEEYIQRARAIIQGTQGDDSPTPSMPLHSKEKLFVDFAHSYADRLINLRSFWALDHLELYLVLRSGLATTLELLYTQTNAPLIGNSDRLPIQYFYVTWASAIVMPIVAIGLFHSSNKQAYRGDDVIVTLVSLYGTLVLEFISVFFMLYSYTRWPDMVGQHSLIGFFYPQQKAHQVDELRKMLTVQGLA